MVQIPRPGLKVGAKPQGFSEGCRRLELTDALINNPSFILQAMQIYAGMYVLLEIIPYSLKKAKKSTAT